MEKCLQRMKEHTSETRLTSEIPIQTLFVPWSRGGKSPVCAAVTAVSSAETSRTCLVWSQNYQPCHLVENSSLKCVFISLRCVGCVSPSSPIDFNSADATVRPQTEMQWHNDPSFFFRFPGWIRIFINWQVASQNRPFWKKCCLPCLCVSGSAAHWEVPGGFTNRTTSCPLMSPAWLQWGCCCCSCVFIGKLNKLKLIFTAAEAKCVKRVHDTSVGLSMWEGRMLESC